MFETIKEMIVNLLKWIALGILNASHWICLAVCLIALLMYIGGQRKAGKYVSISFVINFVLQAIRMVVKE